MPTRYDYYYGDESEQFSYFRIPRLLITDKRFSALSTDAKLLYGLLLDRMGLSARHGWYDELGRVYIYYTLNEIQADMGCGHDKATKLLVELDAGKGIGLIERVRQGQGKPTQIYVKRFTSGQTPSQSAQPQHFTPPSSPDCGNVAVKTAEKPHSRVRKTRSPDCGKSAGIYPDYSYPDNSHLNPSIHPPDPPRWIDRNECRKEVEENIGYPFLCERFGPDDVDGIVALIVDTLCSAIPTFRIGGGDIPAEEVKRRFLSLDWGHLEYVLECMRSNTTQIRNIRAYLLTALYNAPATQSLYYQAEVQHDLG